MGTKWVKFVHRAPALVVAVVVLGLGVMASPTLRMELALPSDATSGVETTQRKSAELMAEGLWRRRQRPFLVVVATDNVDPEAQALRPLVEAQGSPAGRSRCVW